MESFSHIDLYYLTKEFQNLVEQRVDDFFLTENFFTIHIYSKKEKNVFLKNKFGKFLFYDFEKPREEKIKNNFVIFLKKRLKNSYIEKIEMIKNERILKILFRKKNENGFEKFILYIEIFLKGNLILCDENNFILNIFRKDITNRTISKKEKYVLLDEKKFDLQKIDKKEFSKQILKSEFAVAKFIGSIFGIGKKYCEFVLQKSKIDKFILCKDLTLKQIEKIIFELEELKNKKINSCILQEKDKILNFYPFDFEIKNLNFEKNFNFCIKKYFSSFVFEVSKEQVILHNKIDKINSILNSQIKKKEELEKQIKKYEKIVETLYLNFSKYENILNTCLEEKEKHKLNFKTNEIEIDIT